MTQEDYLCNKQSSSSALLAKSGSIQEQIKHPTPAYMDAWLAQVVQDIRLSTTCFLQGVSQDGKALEVQLAIR
jgi:hypothetical protein